MYEWVLFFFLLLLLLFDVWWLCVGLIDSPPVALLVLVLHSVVKSATNQMFGRNNHLIWYNERRPIQCVQEVLCFNILFERDLHQDLIKLDTRASQFSVKTNIVNWNCSEESKRTNRLPVQQKLLIGGKSSHRDSLPIISVDYIKSPSNGKCRLATTTLLNHWIIMCQRSSWSGLTQF